MSLVLSFAILLQAGAGAANWQEGLATYRDPQFDGSLAPEAVALSVEIGDSLRSALPGEEYACPRPDMFSGQLVSDGGKGPKDASAIPEAFAPLVAALDSTSPETVAIAEHAIGLLGPRARFLATQLKRNGMPRDAWASEALSSITCEQWLTPGLVFSGLPHPDRSCAAATAFYGKLAESGARRWPSGALGTEWSEISRECKDDGSGSTPPPDNEIIDRLADLLANQRLDAKRLVETLYIFEDVGQPLKPLAPLLASLAASTDPDIQWSAQRALVASGDRRGVAVLEKMVDDPRAWNMAWQDLITKQKDNASELKPLLVRTLHHPVWNNRVAAAYTIAEFDLVQAVPELAGAVSSKDWLTTEAVVDALGHFVDRSPQASETLERIADSYWSGKVREEAKSALSGPRPETSGLDRIGCLGACPVDHRQEKCAQDGFPSGRYRIASGETVDIRWREEERRSFPHGDITALSSWCHIGTTASHRVAGGWLVGCSGFESDGALGFLEDGEKQPRAFARMGVDFILPLDDRILIAASSPFEAGEAGAVYTARRATDGSWELELISLLPSVPDAYAPVGSGIAFRDGENAVLMASDGGISTLECVNANVP